MHDLAQFSVVAFTSVFILVDPFAAIPAFLVMTAHDDSARRRRMAKRAALTCLIVLGSFGIAGSWIFRVFGITLPAFEIAGGLILLLIGIDMLQARRSSTQEVEPERQEGAEKEDVGITPLGIPMLAGPGAMSTVMVLGAQATDSMSKVIVHGSIIVTMLISWILLRVGDRVFSKLGGSGIRVATRIMGLLLAAVAVQFVIGGAQQAGIIPSAMPAVH